MVPFSREDENGKLNVHEMQTMWFEIHCGCAHYRLGNYRLALKMFGYIEQHLETMLDDAYDFHHYSFRRVTINSYLQMLRYND
jgi:peptide alpha-N-acetyltransferase